MTLAERLAAAVGPSRELDAEILTTLLGYKCIETTTGWHWHGKRDGRIANGPVPFFSSSLDAALALFYEVLPKTWFFRIYRVWPSGEYCVEVWDNIDPSKYPDLIKARAKTIDRLALAKCESIARAKNV